MSASPLHTINTHIDLQKYEFSSTNVQAVPPTQRVGPLYVLPPHCPPGCTVPEEIGADVVGLGVGLICPGKGSSLRRQPDM
jgi:hypothetical protein